MTDFQSHHFELHGLKARDRREQFKTAVCSARRVIHGMPRTRPSMSTDEVRDERKVCVRPNFIGVSVKTRDSGEFKGSLNYRMYVTDVRQKYAEVKCIPKEDAPEADEKDLEQMVVDVPVRKIRSIDVHTADQPTCSCDVWND